ncbi:MAG: cytochrome-c peroxidase [Acidobacteria bacterium]|nr:cytochrome-c peroxidase [Acidobacteriota bacterium]
MAFQMAELARLLPGQDETQVPAGLDYVVFDATQPADNVLTAERVALGRKLYFDVRLSADGSVSCATCHDVTRGFTDQRPTSEGIGGQVGKRNAPTTMNVALLQTLFWDGRSPSLDHQATQPVLNPIEMGHPDGDAAVRAIAGDPDYQQQFQAAYGREVNYLDIGRALGAFERTLVFMDSPFRRFLQGDASAISAEAREGWRLFNEEGRCVTCHPLNTGNPFGTDNRFHNIGVSASQQDFESLAATALRALAEDPSEQKLDELALGTDLGELGRFMVTRNRSDIGNFRTPILANIGITAPYMHDGTMPTLWDVVDHYNKGGEANLYLDGGVEALALSDRQIDDLVAFLFSMTDDRFAAQNDAAMAAQRAAAATERRFRDTALAMRGKLTFEDRITGQ